MARNNAAFPGKRRYRLARETARFGSELIHGQVFKRLRAQYSDRRIQHALSRIGFRLHFEGVQQLGP